MKPHRRPIVTLPQQGTEEWLQARAGKFTASNAKALMHFGKDGSPLKARADLITRVALERITGHPLETPTTKEMQHGHDCEPLARADYTALTGRVVRRAGFAIHPDLSYFGASADGLVGLDGCIEVKSPYNAGVHLATLTANEMPPDHKHQAQSVMFVHDRQWCDFISWGAQFPHPHRLFVQRIWRDEGYFARLKLAVQEAENEARELIAAFDRTARDNSNGYTAAPEWRPLLLAA